MRKGKRDGVVGYENNVYQSYRYKRCSPWLYPLAIAKMISVEPHGVWQLMNRCHFQLANATLLN